jgi:hypothetical protein
MNTATSLLRFDTAAFDPWRVQAVEHSLMSHPLLQLENVIELGKRLESQGRVRSHTALARAETPFNQAPQLHPNPKSAAETLGDIGKAGAWMSLLYVHTDPLYRTLVDEVLDDVRPIVEARDPGMCYRAGWIFVTSPGAVTPFHMDNEHNFILQIAGRKRLYVWDPLDRSVVSELGLEQFHARHSRDLVSWREELREKAVVFDLAPGMGGYMPSTSPHMVENGDGPSITASFTYFTNATRRRNLLFRANHQLRELGLHPQGVGESEAWDAILHAFMRAYVGAKDGVRGVLGRPIQPASAPYAFPRYS